jgi:hypothetical protein
MSDKSHPVLGDEEVCPVLDNAIEQVKAVLDICNCGKALAFSNDCNRCGHHWHTEEGKEHPPVACPRCRSCYYNRPHISPRSARPETHRLNDLAKILKRGADKEQRRADRKRARKLAKLTKMAEALGMKVMNPADIVHVSDIVSIPLTQQTGVLEWKPNPGTFGIPALPPPPFRSEE